MSLIDEILKDHQKAKSLLTQVVEARGTARVKAFQLLIRTLAVHETAEEVLVHPLTGKTSAGADVAAQRTAEEDKAGQVIGQLQQMNPDCPEFDSTFASLHKDVLAHAESEEKLEHPILLKSVSASELDGLGVLYRRLENDALAPTLPSDEPAIHPLLMGPIASFMERLRHQMQATAQEALSEQSPRTKLAV